MAQTLYIIFCRINGKKCISSVVISGSKVAYSKQILILFARWHKVWLKK